MQARKVGNIPFAKSREKSDKSAMEKDELRQKVIRRLNELDLGAVEAASRVEGLERNFIRDLVEGKKHSFSSTKAPLVAEALKWTLEDLQGRRPVKKGHQRIVQVPLSGQITAGGLKMFLHDEHPSQLKQLPFAGLGRGDFYALRVEPDADSMDRISPPGSVIVVDKNDKALINGRYYIFSIKGEQTYKMWQSGKPSYLAPYSTNPMHRPIFIERMRDFDVVGRVKRTVLDL